MMDQRSWWEISGRSWTALYVLVVVELGYRTMGGGGAADAVLIRAHSSSRTVTYMYVFTCHIIPVTPTLTRALLLLSVLHVLQFWAT